MRRPALLAAAAVAASGLAALLSGVLRAAPSPIPSPPGWPAPHYRFDDKNPWTPEGFALGRELFYDPRLSRDGTVSCGSCHQPFAGFAQAGHALSHGVGNAVGARNSPSLSLLAWQPDFMWDGAVNHLELQPIAPISNPREMGESLAHVVQKLRGSPEYAVRFREAFGSPGIDSQRLLRALAQFTATLVPAQTAYDRDALDADQRRGLALFRQHCNGCHTEPLFTDFSYRNNGLDAEPKDVGREGITKRAEDRGRFRVPSLRNVAVSGPYMHDGRFATLDAVLDHYAQGIAPSATLDPQLTRPVPLTAAERQQLKRFLEGLTDPAFLADPRYAEPAREQAAPVPPRVAARSGGLELLLWRADEGWRLAIDDALSNAPRELERLEVSQGGLALAATALDTGLYRLDLDHASAGLPIKILFTTAGVKHRLDLRLPSVTAAVASAARP